MEREEIVQKIIKAINDTKEDAEFFGLEDGVTTLELLVDRLFPTIRILVNLGYEHEDFVNDCFNS